LNGIDTDVNQHIDACGPRMDTAWPLSGKVTISPSHGATTRRWSDRWQTIAEHAPGNTASGTSSRAAAPAVERRESLATSLKSNLYPSAPTGDRGWSCEAQADIVATCERRQLLCRQFRAAISPAAGGNGSAFRRTVAAIDTDFDSPTGVLLSPMRILAASVPSS